MDVGRFANGKRYALGVSLHWTTSRILHLRVVPKRLVGASKFAQICVGENCERARRRVSGVEAKLNCRRLGSGTKVMETNEKKFSEIKYSDSGVRTHAITQLWWML